MYYVSVLSVHGLYGTLLLVAAVFCWWFYEWSAPLNFVEFVSTPTDIKTQICQY